MRFFLLPRIIYPRYYNDMKPLRPAFLLLSVFMFLAGCLSVYPGYEEDSGYMESVEQASKGELNDIQHLLLEEAGNLLGADKIIVRDRKFNFDCTGVVLACYYYAGIDLSRVFPRYSGNGVTRIYRYMEDQKLLHKAETPQTGDIIFWDNTYDRNGDGKENDELTHIGMVVSSSENGEVVFIHVNYSKGIILEKMNRKRGDEYMDGNAVINSPMRMKSAKKSSAWLASHLFRVFGRGYILKPDAD